MSKVIEEVIKNIQEQAEENSIVDNENGVETEQNPPVENKTEKEPAADEAIEKETTQESQQEKEQKPDTDDNDIEKQESDLPEWAQGMSNEYEYDVANMLAGGKKAEWLTQGYDNFSKEQKKAFANMHSKKDKWFNQTQQQQQQQQAVQKTQTADETVSGLTSDDVREAGKLKDRIKKERPDLVEALNEVISSEKEPGAQKNTEIDLEDIKEEFINASQEYDTDKIGNVFDNLVNVIGQKTEQRVINAVEQRDKELEKRKQEETLKQKIEGYQNEIDGIIRRGDRRIEKYLQKNPDGSHAIGRMLAFGDPVTGKQFDSVKDAYHHLLRMDRGSGDQGLPKPDFSAQPDKGGSPDEGELDVSDQEVRSKGLREYMNDWSGWK